VDMGFGYYFDKCRYVASDGLTLLKKSVPQVLNSSRICNLKAI